jgi:S1-C subfamily serine protease
LKSDSDPKSVQGVQVIAVIKGSPAENAGVQKNDSITSVSGKLVENPDDLINAIKKNKGKSIELGYIRNGKQSKVSVKL